MKHAKTAALVAGSVVALGAASPAFAADAAAGQRPNPSGMQHEHKAAKHHGGAENALSGKKLGAGQALPLVRSIADSEKAPHKGKTVGQHNHVKKGKQGQNSNSSPLGGLGSVTKGLPLLGGLPIGN